VAKYLGRRTRSKMGRREREWRSRWRKKDEEQDLKGKEIYFLKM
jgi:hypothetical protein